MNQYNTQTQTRQTASSFDQGLADHFRGVYNVMSIGLVLTGIVAYGLAQWDAAIALMFGTPLKWIVIFAPLAFIFFGFTRNAIQTKTSGQLKTMFYLFSAVMGASMASIFLVYQGADIARAFFITAATFAATSAYGYITKRDLSKMGSFLIMGVIGLVIASVVNIFLASSAMQWAISVIGVFLFIGLTAYDTQNIKESYSANYASEDNSKMAVMGALSLYINFINLFQFILSLIGNRE